jgi:hypothetical protein
VFLVAIIAAWLGMQVYVKRAWEGSARNNILSFCGYELFDPASTTIDDTGDSVTIKKPDPASGLEAYSASGATVRSAVYE